jgi:DNA-binding NtrC family response regulator
MTFGQTLRNEPERDGPDELTEFGGLLGGAPAMVRLRRNILRAAASPHPVLVTGPTGAGKELVARALHDLGARPQEPFLDLNCGALPAELIESQLFGHERGAFTGAERRQEGYFAAVRGGTLFLDEIAELPLALQAKLLRALETRRFRAIGSLQDQHFRGRIVAATHVDLRERNERRQFREDLFYRLNVLGLEVPSLDQRRDDIPRLVSHFAGEQPRPLRFTPDALGWLAQRHWPGNVRELRHVIARLAVFCDGDVVTLATLHGLEAPAPAEQPRAITPLNELARQILRTAAADKMQAILDALIDEAMAACCGNKSAAARLLGVHRKVVERIYFARERSLPPGWSVLA